MHPGRRGQSLLEREYAADNEVADDQDRKVGRRVVGAVVMQRLAAARAAVPDLEISPEQAALAAAGAALREAAQHRAHEIARRPGTCFIFDHDHEISDAGPSRVAAY